MRTGVNRFGDVANIVGEVLKWIPPVVSAAVAAVLVIPWLLARAIERKVVRRDRPSAGTRRARWTAAASAMALLTWMASPDSSAMPVRALRRNVLLQMAVGQAGVDSPSGDERRVREVNLALTPGGGSGKSTRTQCRHDRCRVAASSEHLVG